ncbi:hypothetical protein SARC_09415, partial [Sphaeroforma arctica JP610]
MAEADAQAGEPSNFCDDVDLNSDDSTVMRKSYSGQRPIGVHHDSSLRTSELASPPIVRSRDVDADMFGCQ